MMVRGTRWLHALACALPPCTLFLIFAGALVTSTDSGLAVPDWPLSFGQFMPEMVGGVFYEHGHRMIATAIGLMTLVLCVGLLTTERRRWVRWLGIFSLAAVVAQGILGGMTVLYKLPWQVSTAHGVLAQLFLCATVALAAVTSSWWHQGSFVANLRIRNSYLALALVSTVAIVCQLVLGALMRHWDAGLIIPDFPLAYGRLIPPITNSLVAVHFAHRAWAVVTTLLVLTVAIHTLRNATAWPRLRLIAGLILVAVLAQFSLGAITILTQKAPTPTSFHVTGGALLLSLTWLLSVLLLRTRWLQRHAAPLAQEQDA